MSRQWELPEYAPEKAGHHKDAFRFSQVNTDDRGYYGCEDSCFRWPWCRQPGELQDSGRQSAVRPVATLAETLGPKSLPIAVAPTSTISGLYLLITDDMSLRSK